MILIPSGKKGSVTHYNFPPFAPQIVSAIQNSTLRKLFNIRAKFISILPE